MTAKKAVEKKSSVKIRYTTEVSLVVDHWGDKFTTLGELEEFCAEVRKFKNDSRAPITLGDELVWSA